MKWTDELIKSELLKSIDVLGLQRMPTGEELKSIGQNGLHCKISRSKKYSGWANELGLSLKSSTTETGKEYEAIIEQKIKDMGFEVERMTTKHPYDLLVFGGVKVDVKVANPYLLRGSRVHTFALNKENPTCDIYILAALDDAGALERLFVIPAHLVQMKMINMGLKSKYNRFIDAWDYLDEFSIFYKQIT
jgi:hypothetical protein